MRFATPIYFQRIVPGEYDASTGNYGADTITEDLRRASVTDTGTATLNLVYGGLKQGSKVVRLQRHYNKPFDRIRIGDRVYRVDLARGLRLKHTFVVSEVQGNG